MHISSDIKNINITKTTKLDVIGKSKLQNTYLEILKKKTNSIFDWTSRNRKNFPCCCSGGFSAFRK